MKYKTAEQYKEYDKATALALLTDYHVVALVRNFYYAQKVTLQINIIRALDKRITAAEKCKTSPKKYWREAKQLLLSIDDQKFQFLVRQYK